jgi:hypothetical protein
LHRPAAPAAGRSCPPPVTGHRRLRGRVLTGGRLRGRGPTRTPNPSRALPGSSLSGWLPYHGFHPIRHDGLRHPGCMRCEGPRS